MLTRPRPLSTSRTHINSRAGFRLALPSLCLLLFICCGFSLIWQLSWFPLRFLRDGRCRLFLFLLRGQGQRLEVVTSGLGHGVCVIQQEVMLFLVLDHLPVYSDSPEPGPGQRSWVLLTLKQIPWGHLLLRGHLETLWRNNALWPHAQVFAWFGGQACLGHGFRAHSASWGPKRTLAHGRRAKWWVRADARSLRAAATMQTFNSSSTVLYTTLFRLWHQTVQYILL